MPSPVTSFSARSIWSPLVWGLTAFCAFLSLSQPVAAQSVYVQSTKTGGTDLDTLAASFAAAPATNDLIVVGITVWDPDAADGDLPAGSVTDNKGNTYTRATIATNGVVRTAIFYAIAAISNGTFTVTANPVGVGADLSVAIHDYSGNFTAAVLDVATSTTGTSLAPNSGNIVTTASNDLIFGTMTELTDFVMSPGATFTEGRAGAQLQRPDDQHRGQDRRRRGQLFGRLDALFE